MAIAQTYFLALPNCHFSIMALIFIIIDFVLLALNNLSFFFVDLFKQHKKQSIGINYVYRGTNWQ